MNEAVVKPYLQLREELSRRDKSLREKVVTLEDAASFVQDGMSVGIGGSTMSRTPMAMIWALIRARKKHLSCSRSIVSTEGDLLFGSGVCDHMITSWFAQGILWGVSKVMRHHTENKLARVTRNGATWRSACAFAPAPWAFRSCRSARCSAPTFCKQRPEAKEIDCPFTGEKLLLVPALNPDVALIHVQRCDAYGNAQIDGLQFMDIDLAMAANRVILTTERIVSNDQIRRAPDQTKIPFFCVDAVVEVPFGCAPHECYGALRAVVAAHRGLRRAGRTAIRSTACKEYLDALCLRAEILDRLSLADRHGRSARCDAAAAGASTMTERASLHRVRTPGRAQRAAAAGRAGRVRRRRHPAAGRDAGAAHCAARA